MIAFLKLVRYKNLLMVLLTLILTKYALIESFVSSSYLNGFEFLILATSIIFITAGGYIINDIFDIQADKINKPGKVLVEKTITKKNAKILYTLFAVIGLSLGIYISYKLGEINYSLIFLFTIISLYLYSKKLKGIAIIGNLTVSLLVALTIVTVFLFESINTLKASNLIEAIGQLFNSLSLSIKVLGYTIFAFTITALREVIKDIEDIKGDYAVKMKTLPIILGIESTTKLLFFYTGFIFIFLIFVLKELIELPYLMGYSLLFVLLPFAWFMYKLRIAKKTKHFNQLSKLLKLIMFFGILSMILFKF
jgi:4-hydroxybenzoate polyprenyltransferase